MIRRTCFATVFLFLVSQTVAVQAQDQALRSQLFAAADMALAAAKEAQADVLAPTSYEQGAEHYRDAEADLSRGRGLEGIRANLAEAVRLFNQATKATELARVSLRDAFAARDDAQMAEAPTFAGELWREAEQSFSDAARRLEDGNMNRAQRSADEAEAQYRSAELGAIETNYLDGTRRLIATADDRHVDRYAPKTLARAKSLLAEAEMRLRTDRYDTDLPRSLAREANYEARHAMHLAERVEAVDDDRNVSAEDVLLEAEQPLTRIAGELDLVAELDTGYADTTAAIVERIDGLVDDRESLRQREERVAFLEDELSRLEAQLGEESEQRRLQEQIQQRF